MSHKSVRACAVSAPVTPYVGICIPRHPLTETNMQRAEMYAPIPPNDWSRDHNQLQMCRDIYRAATFLYCISMVVEIMVTRKHTKNEIGKGSIWICRICRFSIQHAASLVEIKKRMNCYCHCYCHDQIGSFPTCHLCEKVTKIVMKKCSSERLCSRFQRWRGYSVVRNFRGQGALISEGNRVSGRKNVRAAIGGA